jgi:hypothetical protein
MPESEDPFTGTWKFNAQRFAYTRVNRNSIRGTGKKNGAITLTETISVNPDGRILTLSYTIHNGAQEIARGIAVFEKTHGVCRGRALSFVGNAFHTVHCSYWRPIVHSTC